MSRLFVQIYLTIIASLLLVVFLSGALWHFAGRDQFNRDVYAIAGKLAAGSLAKVGVPLNKQQEQVRNLAENLKVDIALYTRQYEAIAAWGNPLPPPSRDIQNGGKVRGFGGPSWQILLPDKRWLVVGVKQDKRPALLAPVVFLGAIALIIGLCAYPLVRRMTRRLERLQQGVERIGAGDFSTRVQVEGKDEVARLASSFNQATEKIEKLLGAHQQLLANASHELRTPLSRIRLGIDLLKGKDDEKRKRALEQDIGELDQLVDEILLMSRLDAHAGGNPLEQVDLLAIAAEECAHFEDCALEGSSIEIAGDIRLLQRLMRNMLQNAHRHGVPPVEVRVMLRDDDAVIEVLDHGPGVPSAEREKVFAPFYRLADRQDVKGSGLGLALVAQIAENHGGKASMFVDEHTGLFGVRVSLPQ
jgi:signal transduction histidine kinase